MTPTPVEPHFDRSVVLDRVGGDHDLLKEVVQLFLEDAPGLLTQVRCAIGCGDAPALERAAHTLKGLVGNFGATGTASAFQLESMGRQKNLDQAPAVVQQLDQQLAELTSALQALIREDAA